MSELKNVIIKKTTPNDVYFTISPLSNTSISKSIYLTNRLPQQNLPIDWALGIFLKEEVYNMFKKGLFTFNDIDGVLKAAIEAGVYFDESLDFKPSTDQDVPAILKILSEGNRSKILSAIDKYGKDKVRDVAIQNANNLTTGVVTMLEGVLGIQLILDGSTSYQE